MSHDLENGMLYPGYSGRYVPSARERRAYEPDDWEPSKTCWVCDDTLSQREIEAGDDMCSSCRSLREDKEV
jgi:hypothetical protein